MFNSSAATVSIWRIPFLRKMFLAISWILGLVFGILFALQLPATSVSLMRTITLESTSIVGLAFVLSFPLIMSAVALWLSKPLLLFPIAFLKAFSFAYLSLGIVTVFRNAGWLLRWLFVFSDSFMVICLLWLWFRNISESRDTANRDLLICTLFAGILFSIDYFMVSPFVLMLFNH